MCAPQTPLSYPIRPADGIAIKLNTINNRAQLDAQHANGRAKAYRKARDGHAGEYKGMAQGIKAGGHREFPLA